MVGVKKIKNKIKIPSRSKNKHEASADGPEPSNVRSHSATATAGSDIRAQYYSSRNISDESGGGSGNTFGRSSSAIPRMASRNNPFEDDDDDEEDIDDDDPLSRFGKKKAPPPPPPAAASASASKPSASLTSSGVGMGGGAGNNNPFESPAAPSAKKSNPFDDSPVGGGSVRKSFSTGASKKNVNPFEEDEDDGNGKRNGGGRNTANDRRQQVQSSPSMRMSFKKSGPMGGSNPFGEDGSDSGNNANSSVRPPRPAGAATGVGGEDVKPASVRPSRGLDKTGSSMRRLAPDGISHMTPSATSGSAPAPRTSVTNKSNPFGDDSPAAPVPKPLLSQPQNYGSNTNVSGMNPGPNPFDSDGGGGPAAKRGWMFGAGGRGGDTDSTRPMLSAMDEDSTIEQRIFQPKNAASNNAAGLASWLRMNKREDERNEDGRDHMDGGAGGGRDRKRKTKKKKCRAVVTPWPFDYYHEEQERMYEELASRAASDHHVHDGGYHSGSDDEKKDDILGNGMGTVANKYYERPEELPSIKEAVNDLPLVEFEKKAEERAINIVSTWLFDAGLIDELLVNGAMSASVAHQASRMASNTSVDGSVKTSEGVEVGAHGFPLVGAEGAELKMDKETNKLRGAIQRDLAIINARLNDGVAASGLEVQELVNAVGATKDDIGRLRELTTYISDGQISDRDEFLLAQYPYLRKAINARRNINRCFRELEFFSQIPSTCERLRDELHGGEWTAEEWNTIRNVSMEHVELEMLLIEAENSMKGADQFNDAMVDRFLETHVGNVWELGEEIRMRILSGIGSAFDLAVNNPAGIVALVEAVEVYERAAETFEKKRQDSKSESGNLRFTNMRAAALEQLYQDFELRGVEMFKEVHEGAADDADEEDASNSQFTAVLQAATELVAEIDIVKIQMAPCFAPHWHVEALWSSCVAHVCSNHIVQQIGGPDGQNLPELTITQLLELVAWVEFFRETIEETFPDVTTKRDTKKTYFEERPDLFAGDKRSINMETATDSLAWVNNMLWEVHRLAQEEFLVRTRTQTDEWLTKVYGSETVKNQSAEGKLTTSLCEDIFSFSSVQLRTIRERLSKKSDALILAVCVILSHMRTKQIHSRNNFLEDLETCCAASNDFTRMSERCEDMMSELLSQCEFSDDMIATLEASSNELMGVYSSDAVYAARSVHIYVFDPIEEEIGSRLFEIDWEENMTGNDLAVSLVRTLEDFHDDLETYMDDFMVVKSVMSLMSATVIFYAKTLLLRAEKHRSNKRPFFGDNKRALDRMTGDIKIMREYFEGLANQMPALKKHIEKDFENLSTLHELMCIAAGFSDSDAEDFIFVLQKRVRDVGITKHIVGDLWHLMAPTGERYVWELVESMEDTLEAIAPQDDALALEVNDRSYVKGLRLDEMAVSLYVKSKRNRPIKATAVESMVKNWRTTWSAQGGEGTPGEGDGEEEQEEE